MVQGLGSRSLFEGSPGHPFLVSRDPGEFEGSLQGVPFWGASGIHVGPLWGSLLGPPAGPSNSRVLKQGPPRRPFWRVLAGGGLGEGSGGKVDEKVTKSSGLGAVRRGTLAPTSDVKMCVNRAKGSPEFCISCAKGCLHIGVCCARRPPEICVSCAKGCSQIGVSCATELLYSTRWHRLLTQK